MHIAAPGVVIGRDHPLDAVARARMSTVYAPGLKYTMLPDGWVDAFSLNEGRVVPVLSLYARVDAETCEVLSTETRVERLRIAANLRHDLLDDVITEETIAGGAFDAPFAAELAFLWRVARTLLARREEVRGRPEPLGRDRLLLRDRRRGRAGARRHQAAAPRGAARPHRRRADDPGEQHMGPLARGAQGRRHLPLAEPRPRAHGHDAGAP